MASTSGRKLRRANPNTIQDKFLVGYQGWFTCPGDGEPVHRGHHGWLHWVDKPLTDGGRPTIDLWPDVSAYGPDELFPAPGFTLPDGSTPRLFSSRHPATVGRHFHWMAEHGVDGVFLQRFASQCEVGGRTTGATADLMRLRDEVLGRVRAAAEQEGRVWAIMYDVGSTPPERLEHLLRTDWAHLRNDLRVLESPNYLREGGRPVIALWGLGFSNRSHSADLIRNIVRGIRSDTPNGAYIMAGTATHWATSKNDADPNPELLDVWYHEFDAISPWTVGRYKDEESADRFAREKIQNDLEALKANTDGRQVDYIPVVFPGGSGHHITHGQWTLNQQPRNGGRLLWRQLYNARKAGVRIIYGAMWDEYDEGTAFLPVVPYKRQLPSPGPFLSLDADGYDLPSDWYMRICGFISEVFHNERTNQEAFPVKELQDYWSSHPKYEDGQEQTSSAGAGSSGAASSSGGVSQSFEQWCEQERETVEEAPPPPYTLEDESTTATDNQSTGTPLPPRPIQSQSSGAQPPIPTHSRPGSVSSTAVQSSSVPPSSHEERPLPPEPHFENRPTDQSSVSSSTQPQGLGRSQSNVSPGEVYRHNLHGSVPHAAPEQIPWQTRPSLASLDSGEGAVNAQSQSSLRPSASLSTAHGRGGESNIDPDLRNPWGTGEQGGREDTGAGHPPMQWPPSDWNANRPPNIPPRPASSSQAHSPLLPPPIRLSNRPPPVPPKHPSTPTPDSAEAPAPGLPYQPRIRPGRPQANSPFLMPTPSPTSSSGFSAPGAGPLAANWDSPFRAPSPYGGVSPYPTGPGMGGPGEPNAYGYNGYPQEPTGNAHGHHHDHGGHEDYAHHNHDHNHNHNQNYDHNEIDYGAEPGGFVPPVRRTPSPVGGQSPSSAGAPSIPPRPPHRQGGPTYASAYGMPTGPMGRGGGGGGGGTIPPGGFVTRFGGMALGAVDRVAGSNARKRVEDGVDTLSSAGTRIYQRFR